MEKLVAVEVEVDLIVVQGWKMASKKPRFLGFLKKKPKIRFLDYLF